MSKITNEIVEKSFEIGKQFFQKEITLKKAISILSQIGMKKNSAVAYVYSYSNFMQGKLFRRNINTYAIEYYLQKIYEEEGMSGLENALLSLSKHIDYYEEKSGSKIISKKEIYHKFLKLTNNNFHNTVYPDEVDSKIKYSEGKTKQVLVNSYERKPIARKKCIEHYGLNCQVCNFSFEKKYGTLGKDFIHVHHIIDISSIGHEYSIDPIKDLIPVCPNCHSMLHKTKPALSIETLKKKLNSE